MLEKDMSLAADLSHILQASLRHHGPQIGLHEPTLPPNAWSYVKETIDTNWVSPAGPFVKRFEEKLESIVEAKVVAVNTGTSALHLSLLACGVLPDEEVLVPALTFVATANAVSYCRAVPHFVDCDRETLTLCPKKLRTHLETVAEKTSWGCVNRKTRRRIRAVIPMHTYGHATDMDPILELASEFGITVIEDAAESLGTQYRDQPTASLGKLGILSFNGNKIVTTGGGGAIVTKDESLAEEIRHISTTAKIKKPVDNFLHDQIGFNYRLPNINAALGLSQLEDLDERIAQKKKLKDQYKKLFQGFSGVTILGDAPYSSSNYWITAACFDRAKDNQEFLETSNRLGIQTRPVWTLMHHLPMFVDHPRADLKNAEEIAPRIACLPSSNFLTLRF